MLSEKDKTEIQEMINRSINHFHFDVLEPKLKKLEKDVKYVKSQL
jgi:hypothetical protein